MLARQCGEGERTLAPLVEGIDVPRVRPVAVHLVQRVVVRRAVDDEHLAVPLEVREQVLAEQHLVAGRRREGVDLARVGGDRRPLGCDRSSRSSDRRASRASGSRSGRPQCHHHTGYSSSAASVRSAAVAAARADGLVVGMAVAAPRRAQDDLVARRRRSTSHEAARPGLLVGRDVTVGQVEAS